MRGFLYGIAGAFLFWNTTIHAFGPVPEPTSSPHPLAVRDSSNINGVATHPWGLAHGLAYDNTRNAAFLAVGRRVLILDLSNLSAIDTVASLPLNDIARDLAYDPTTQRLYAANEYDGEVTLWDVSTLSDPTLLGTAPLEPHLKAIEVRHDTLFGVTFWAKLLLYDVSNPASPQFLASITVPGAPHGLALQGDYAYLALAPLGATQGGLAVVHLPSATPVGLFTPSGGDWCWDVEVSGTYAYVASDSGFRVIDVQNPAAPTQVTYLPFGGPAGRPHHTLALNLQGSYAYLTTVKFWRPYGSTLQVVDISVPTSPSVTHSQNLDHSWVQEILARGNRLLLSAGHRGGLEVWDLTNPGTPGPVLGTFGIPEAGFFLKMAFLNDTAYIATGFQGIGIVDFTDATHPVWLATFALPSGAAGVPAVDPSLRRLHVATSEGEYYIYDLTHAASPSLLGSASFSQFEFTGLQLQGTYAYLSDVDSGLVVLSVADPTNIQRVASLNLTGTGRGLRVLGSYAYVAADLAGLHIVNIANPANPTLVGNFHRSASPFPLWDVDVNGIRAYLAYYDSLLVVNVGTPSHPTRAGGISGGNSRILGVRVAGSRILVSNYGEGLRIYDPSLNQLGYNNWPNYLFQVYPVQNGAYLVAAEGPAGFHVYQPTGGATRVAESPRTPGAYPRLWSSAGDLFAEVPEAGILRLYDVTGRQVWHGSLPKGVHQIPGPSQSGVYLWTWKGALRGKVWLLR